MRWIVSAVEGLILSSECMMKNSVLRPHVSKLLDYTGSLVDRKDEYMM